VDWGVDANGNGVLDPSEIAGSGDICNGTAGANGQDAGVLQIQVGTADSWNYSNTGYFYSYYGINYAGGTKANAWNPAVSDGAGGFTTLSDGNTYPYDANPITNTTGATQTVDVFVAWGYESGSVAVYNGAFDPTAPLTNLVATNEAWNIDCANDPFGLGNSCGENYINEVTLTLAAGESRTVVATSYYAVVSGNQQLNYDYYDLSVQSSEPVTAAAAAAGLSGNIQFHLTHWYQVTGLTPYRAYGVSVASGGFAHGEQVSGIVSDASHSYRESYWGFGTYDVTKGIDVTDSDMWADGNGTLYVAVYGTTVNDAGGAYTLTVTPGYENHVFTGQGAVWMNYPYAAGTVNKGVNAGGTSNYTVNGWLNGTLISGDTYKVVLSGVSDPATTLTVTGGNSGAACSAKAVVGTTITCSGLVSNASTMTFTVDGTPTAAGSTYSLLATATTSGAGPKNSKLGDSFTGNLDTTTAWTNDWTQTAAAGPFVKGGTYFAGVSVDDPGATVTLVDDGATPGVVTCDTTPDSTGFLGCTIVLDATGALATKLTLTLNGAATANGTEFNQAYVYEPVQIDSTNAWGTVSLDTVLFGGSDHTTASTFVYNIPVGGTTYNVMVTSATSDGLVVKWKDNGTKTTLQTCATVASGAASCSAASSATATTITISVDGTGTNTVNGAFYEVELE
jgi:hypothetical protein